MGENRQDGSRRGAHFAKPADAGQTHTGASTDEAAALVPAAGHFSGSVREEAPSAARAGSRVAAHFGTRDVDDEAAVFAELPAEESAADPVEGPAENASEALADDLAEGVAEPGAPEAGPAAGADDGEALLFSGSYRTAATRAAELASGEAASVSDDAVPAAGEDNTPSEADVSRSAALMSVLVIISRITGFLRTWAQAYGMGTTVVASAFTVANNLPNQLYELVMGGMLVTAFLPVYVSAKKRAGKPGAIAYASNLLSLVTIAMLLLSAISFVFAGQIVWTQAFNASADFDFELSTYFLRFFSIEVVLYALSSVISSVLNAERDYFWSTAAPIVNNVVTTASFFGYALFAPSNPTLAILCLAIGNPLGVLVQVLCQLPSLKRCGVKLSLRVDLRDPCIKETLELGIPTLIVTLVSFATTSVQSSCSLSVNPNGAAITYYARMWYVLPYSVFAIPITTAMFTELSTYVANKDNASFVAGVRRGCGRILFLLVPFALYLIVFSPCLARLLGGSRMDTESLEQLASYLAWLSISLPAYGVCTYLQKACSALRRMKLFTVAEIIAGAVQIVFCLAFTPLWGFNVVGFSSTLFFVSIDVVILAFLRRELGPIGLKALVASCARSVALGVLGASVGAAILLALQAFVAPLAGGGIVRALIYTVAGGVPSLLATFGIACMLHLDEAAFIDDLLAKFKRRAASA